MYNYNYIGLYTHSDIVVEYLIIFSKDMCRVDVIGLG